MKKSVLVSLLLLVSLPSAADWRRVVPEYEWDFPEDHWPHRDFRTEWWYFTGHLNSVGEPRRSFGYQYTIFRIGVASDPAGTASKWGSGQLLMGHAAISDKDREEHRFSEILHREVPFLASFSDYPDLPIARALAAPGSQGVWTLAWNGEGFEFSMQDDLQQMNLQLTTRPLKPRILQGPGGYSRKSHGEGAASYYYSYPRLHSSGRLELAGEEFQVTGTSWMDKEFSSAFLSEEQAGWDWFSLQLSDGRDLMLYRLRNRAGGNDYGGGTLIDSDSRASYLAPEDWSLRVVDEWESPETGARYPVRWEIRVPQADLTLEIEAWFDSQENRSRLIPGMSYWEGAVRIFQEGQPVGRGYVEMTGYAPGQKLPL